MKILIAGDFCPNYRVADLIDSGNASSVLGAVNKHTEQADYSIVNFECPIKPDEAEPISKKGPNLSCSSKSLSLLTDAGFNCVTLANNHFRDYGSKGCNLTIESLKNAGIDYVGGGSHLAEAQKILYKIIDGKKLAIINFCENEFSIAIDTEAGAAPLNLIDNYRQITEARKNADYVLVIVHGGHEHFQLPSIRMKKTYQWLIDIGADAVVNHHQHCYSGYEIYNGRPIFYGLGNFCFDWQNRQKGPWNEGFLLILNFGTAISYQIIPYNQCGSDPVINFMLGNDCNTFFAKLNSLNSTLSDFEKLKEKVSEYYNGCSEDCEIMFGNFSDSKIMRKLKRMKLLPRKISAIKRNILRDYIFCESHRDKIEYWLYNK